MACWLDGYFQPPPITRQLPTAEYRQPQPPTAVFSSTATLGKRQEQRRSPYSGLIPLTRTDEQGMFATRLQTQLRQFDLPLQITGQWRSGGSFKRNLQLGPRQLFDHL